MRPLRRLGYAYNQKLNKSNFLKKKSLAGHIKTSFTQAVELEPHNADAQEAMAEFYMEAPGMVGGDKDKAREHVEKLRAIDEERGIALSSLLHAKNKNYAEAEDELLQLRVRVRSRARAGSQAGQKGAQEIEAPLTPTRSVL